MKHSFFFLLLLASELICSCSLVMAMSGRSAVEQMFNLFAAPPSHMSDEKKCACAANLVDYSFISQEALGHIEWNKLSPGQKHSLVASLKALIEHRYYPRWYKLFNKGQLTYTGQQESYGDILVKTNLVIHKKIYPLTWRLHPHGDKLMLVSLSFEEDDLLSRLHSRLHKQVQKKGIDHLLAGLKKKAAEHYSKAPGREVSLQPGR